MNEQLLIITRHEIHPRSKDPYPMLYISVVQVCWAPIHIVFVRKSLGGSEDWDHHYGKLTLQVGRVFFVDSLIKNFSLDTVPCARLLQLLSQPSALC